MIKIISSEEAPKAVGPFSQAIKYGNLVFVSGQLPIIPQTGEIANGSVAEQTERVLSNIEAILKAAGSSLDKVLKCNVYLADLKYFQEMNNMYKRYFTKDYPARLTVAVAGIFGGLAVEIDCIAGIE